MPKFLKILFSLIAIFIVIAAFAITRMVYFDNSDDNQKTEKSNSQETTTETKKETSGEEFKFAICGDPHSDWETYETILKDAEKKDVEFLINLGDLTRVGAESEYLEGKSLMAEFEYDTYLVMGGHDRVGNGETSYQKHFGKDYYSFNEDDAHFVVLNNSDQKEGIPADQLKWIENDLTKNKKQFTFVFAHQPIGFPYANSKTVGYLTEESQKTEQDLIDIVKQHKITMFFAGHLHSYFPYEFEGISAIITGGAGGPPHELPFIENTSFHYVLGTIKDDKFDYEVVEME